MKLITFLAIFTMFISQSFGDRQLLPKDDFQVPIFLKREITTELEKHDLGELIRIDYYQVQGGKRKFNVVSCKSVIEGIAQRYTLSGTVTGKAVTFDPNITEFYCTDVNILDEIYLVRTNYSDRAYVQQTIDDFLRLPKVYPPLLSELDLRIAKDIVSDISFINLYELKVIGVEKIITLKTNDFEHVITYEIKDGYVFIEKIQRTNT